MRRCAHGSATTSGGISAKLWRDSLVRRAEASPVNKRLKAYQRRLETGGGSSGRERGTLG